MMNDIWRELGLEGTPEQYSAHFQACIRALWNIKQLLLKRGISSMVRHQIACVKSWMEVPSLKSHEKEFPYLLEIIDTLGYDFDRMIELYEERIADHKILLNIIYTSMDRDEIFAARTVLLGLSKGPSYPEEEKFNVIEEWEKWVKYYRERKL